MLSLFCLRLPAHCDLTLDSDLTDFFPLSSPKGCKPCWGRDGPLYRSAFPRQRNFSTGYEFKLNNSWDLQPCTMRPSLPDPQ